MEKVRSVFWLERKSQPCTSKSQLRIKPHFSRSLQIWQEHESYPQALQYNENKNIMNKECSVRFVVYLPKAFLINPAMPELVLLLLEGYREILMTTKTLNNAP